MSLVSSCDDLEYWTAFNGVHALDTLDKQEGLASIVLTGNGIDNWIHEEYNPPGTWDWSDKTWLAARLNLETTRELRIYLVDVNGVLARWYFGLAPPGWSEYPLDLDAPTDTTGAFDKSQVDRFEVWLSTQGTPYYIKIDDVRVGPTALTHLLTVNSMPVTGIPFTITKEGIQTSHVTDWSGMLEEGTYEVAMPSNIIVNGDIWNFKAQVDPITKEPISTNPITTVNLTADSTLEYAYELLALTAIQIHAFYKGAEVNANGLIVETATEFTTPATIEVSAGVYTVQVRYLSQTQISSVEVLEGQTVRIDEQFLGPTPIPPVAIVAVMLAVPVGYILWKMLKR